MRRNRKLFRNLINSSSLIYGIPIFILTIIYVFLPFKSNQYTYEWNPKVDGNSVRLTLLELNPKEFEIIIPCIAIAKEKEWIFEALGGPAFLFEADANYFYFTTGIPQSDTLIVNKIPRPTTNKICSSVLKYDDKFDEIKLVNGSVTNSYALIQDTKFYFSSYVKWNNNLVSDDFLLKVTTKSLIGAEKNPLKTLNLLLILALIFFRLRIEISRFLKKIIKFVFRKDRYDLFAVFAIGLSIISVAPMADDGLYLIEARILEIVGDLIQFQYPVTFPTGHIHAWVNGLSSEFNSGIFYARLIPGIILYLIWRLISAISEKYQSPNNKSKIVLFSFWTLFIFSFGMTLRPETYISLIFLGLIYSLTNSSRDKLGNSISYTLIGTALALSVHQSGLVILFAAIPVWIIGFKRRSALKRDVEKISYSLVISVLIFFQNSSLFLFIKRYQNFERVNEWPQPFTGDFRWGYPPYFEYMRLVHLKFATPSQILLVTLTLFVFAILLCCYKYFKKSLIVGDSNDYLIYLTLLSAPFGLIFAPSKWAGHYAALFSVLIMGYLMIRKLSSKVNIFHFALIFISMFPLILPWKNGGSDTINLTLNFRSNFFESYYKYQTLIFFFVLIGVLALFLIWRVSKNFNLKYMNIFTAFVLTLNPLLQISPNLIDSLIRDSGWTFSRQIFREIGNSNSECGIYDKNELSKIPIDVELGSFVFNQESYVYFSCLNPILPERGAWNFPNYSVGGIPVWDQQRLANESKIERIYCPFFENRSFEDQVDRCIYRWTSLIPDMPLASSEKVNIF